MTKTIIVVGLLLLLVSCNQNGEELCPSTEKPQTVELNEEKPLTNAGCEVTDPVDDGIDDGHDHDEPGEVDEGVPYEAGLFDADVTLSKFDANDEIKVRKAISIIKKVVRTAEFRSRVINFEYNGQRKFVDNEGMTNEQIYQKLLDGTEDLRPDLDNQMDLELELYYSSRNTVGYTYPSGLKIWMNTKYFDVYSPAEVAHNVFHEWTHKLGFGHASSYSASRNASVPYALGFIMEELGKKFE